MWCNDRGVYFKAWTGKLAIFSLPLTIYFLLFTTDFYINKKDTAFHRVLYSIETCFLFGLVFVYVVVENYLFIPHKSKNFFCNSLFYSVRELSPRLPKRISNLLILSLAGNTSLVSFKYLFHFLVYLPFLILYFIVLSSFSAFSSSSIDGSIQSHLLENLLVACVL